MPTVEPFPAGGYRFIVRESAAASISRRKLPGDAAAQGVARVTGWQRHLVRGVFSGTVKKKLGLTLASAKEERRVYRIAELAIV